MRCVDIVLEAIHAPYAEAIRSIIEDVVTHAADVGTMRSDLARQLTTFVQDKFEQQPRKVRDEKLVVHIHPRTKSYPGGGAFRGDEDDEQHELPPRQDGVVDIFAFVDDERLEAWLDPSYRTGYNFQAAIDSLASTIGHELVHAIQFSRAAKKKHSTLTKYTIGRQRQKADGKRYGKRGGYTGGWQDKPRQYYGQNIEIDAHAASAAAEIMFRARREPKEQQAAYIAKVLRTLKDNSMTLATYREHFRNLDLARLLFKRQPNDPRTEQQRAKVWKLFKQKLVQHLTDYLPGQHSLAESIVEWAPLLNVAIGVLGFLGVSYQRFRQRRSGQRWLR